MFRKPPASPPEPQKPAAPPQPPPPARRFTDQAAQGTVLLAGLRIVGEVSGGDSVDIGGTLEGDLRVEGLCRIREKGRVAGSVSATQVLIEGEVEGARVTAAEKVELRSRSKVRAELEATTVAIADGAEFHGGIRMRGGGRGQVGFREKRGEARPAGG